MNERAANLWNALVREPTRMICGLWGRRELVRQFTRRNIEIRHRGSRLGPLWALLTPLSMLALYFFIFGYVYDTRYGAFPGETKYDFSLALLLSLSLFHVFTETLSAAPGLIVANPNFVKKVVFPLEILPLAQLGAAVFHFGVTLVLVIVASLFGTLPLSLQVLWLPVLILPMLLLALGISYLLSAVGVFVRDIGQVTAFVATALLFASAVMYPTSKLPAGFQWLHFNPLLQIVDLTRRTVLWHQPIAWDRLGYVYLCAAGVFILGAVFFSLLRKSFAEVL